MPTNCNWTTMENCNQADSHTPRLASRMLVATITLVLCAGCGSGQPETAPVEGTVRLSGEPVTSGRVTFYPEQGRPATGHIGADGTYTLTTFDEGDGALLGKHRVTIRSTHVDVQSVDMPKSIEDEVARGGRGETRMMTTRTLQWLVPEPYSRRKSSPLTAEVTMKPNRLDFDLSEAP